MEYPHRTRKCKMSKPVVHKRTILLRMYVAPPQCFIRVSAFIHSTRQRHLDSAGDSY